MNTVLARPRLRITTDRYQRMVDTGVLTAYDHVELIEGEILEMAPIGARHSSITARLHELLVLSVSSSATIVSGGPLNLGPFSQLQPDLMLLRRRADFYAEKIPQPADVGLLIEVSDSSLTFDIGVKRDLYAQHGILEYWVLNVSTRQVIIYRNPSQHGYVYVDIHEVSCERLISPIAFPQLMIATRDLFI